MLCNVKSSHLLKMPFSALRDDYSVDGSEEIDRIVIVKLAK